MRCRQARVAEENSFAITIDQMPKVMNELTVNNAASVVHATLLKWLDVFTQRMSVETVGSLQYSGDASLDYSLSRKFSNST